MSENPAKNLPWYKRKKDEQGNIIPRAEPTPEPHAEAEQANTAFEGEERLFEHLINDLTDYIPPQNRPTLKYSARIKGISRRLQEEGIDEVRLWTERQKETFDEPSSKVGKALEVMLTAFTVKNEEEAGGLHWAGRKSTSVLAHEAQDYRRSQHSKEGMTDCILILHGAQESYAPSQVGVRVDATTGSSSLLRKVRRNLDFLKTSHMGELPFTTLPLGGGLDIQGANLENTPLLLAGFDRKTVLELAELATNTSTWGTLRSRPEQLMLLKEFELQALGYASYLVNNLQKFQKEWAAEMSEIAERLNHYEQNSPHTHTERNEMKDLKRRRHEIRKAWNPKTLEKTRETLIQTSKAAHERFLERTLTLFQAELESYRLKLGADLPKFETSLNMPLTHAEQEALARAKKWLGSNKKVQHIPLSEVDVIYRAAWRNKLLPWQSLLDYIPYDSMYVEIITTFASFVDPKLLRECFPMLDRIGAMPQGEFTTTQIEGRKYFGRAFYDVRDDIKAHAQAHPSPLVSLRDIDEALEKFPYPDEKNRAKYLMLTTTQNSETNVQTTKPLPSLSNKPKARSKNAPSAGTGTERQEADARLLEDQYQSEAERIRKRIIQLATLELRRRIAEAKRKE